MTHAEIAKFKRLMQAAIKNATLNNAGAPVDPFLHFCWSYQDTLVSALMFVSRDTK